MTHTEKRIAFERKFSLLILHATLVLGLKPMVFSAYRTRAEQRTLFDEGKSQCDGTAKVSKHQLWLARDIVLIDDDGQPIWKHTEDYDKLGEIWETLGGTWGGNWVSFIDIYHFEL